MATATGFQVTRSADPGDRPYVWLVIDPDGDVADQFETRAEALRDARERQADWDLEQRDQRLMDLRTELEGLLGDCEDEDLLSRIKTMLEQ